MVLPQNVPPSRWMVRGRPHPEGLRPILTFESLEMEEDPWVAGVAYPSERYPSEYIIVVRTIPTRWSKWDDAPFWEGNLQMFKDYTAVRIWPNEGECIPDDKIAQCLVHLCGAYSEPDTEWLPSQKE